MGDIPYDSHGFTGCNFCGFVRCHNVYKKVILWNLCRRCLSIKNSVVFPPRKDSFGPSYHCERDVPKSATYWYTEKKVQNNEMNVYHYKIPKGITSLEQLEKLNVHTQCVTNSVCEYEILPEFKNSKEEVNQYHLLLPFERNANDREHEIKIPCNAPGYNTALRLCGFDVSPSSSEYSSD